MRVAWLLLVVMGHACGSLPASGADVTYTGLYVDGIGDVSTLEAIDAAFECLRPTARMASLPLLYRREWNGFHEGPTWPAWWVQNSFGSSYTLMPFLGEQPYAQWIEHSQALWFRSMADGKRCDSNGMQAPDGCLCDAANLETVSYVQGDGDVRTHDWGFSFTAAALLLECERLLVRHDPAAAQARMGELKRAAAFLDSRRERSSDLLLAGRAANLLAPSYAGVVQPDGTIGNGYLAELSVIYVAALRQLAEVCELCGTAETASIYRAVAERVCRALPKLKTTDGYFVRSLDPDGTRHGVLDAPRHGYFEASPNHDAGCFGVVDAQANNVIVRRMLSITGTAAPGGLIPHGLVIPNYPSYDDHSGEGDMTYGTWVNGGHWTTAQGRMSVACMRAGYYAHPLQAWSVIRKLMTVFRADAPLGEWGLRPWRPQLAQPYNIVYDCWAAPGGLIRGLFQYEYQAEGIKLSPRIPPGIHQYSQKVPASFGDTRIYLAVTGTGDLKRVTANKTPLLPDKDGSVFLALDGQARTVRVEFVRGNARARETWDVHTGTLAVSNELEDAAFWTLLAYPPPSTENLWPLRIGASQVTNLFLTACVRNFRLYDVALSDAQIAARAHGDEVDSRPVVELPLETPPQAGAFLPRSPCESYGDALMARCRGRSIKVVDGGAFLDGSSYLELPPSGALDFAASLTLELCVRPERLDGYCARIVDRLAPGTRTGYALDYLYNSGTLRMITPYGTAQAEAPLPLRRWQHIAGTCSSNGVVRLYVNGRRLAETRGVPRWRQVRSYDVDLVRVGSFLNQLEKQGLGRSYEAGQARVAAEMAAARHQRRALVQRLELPHYRVNGIPRADTDAVDLLYVRTIHDLVYGLLDHLSGESPWKEDLDAHVRMIAEQVGFAGAGNR